MAKLPIEFLSFGSAINSLAGLILFPIAFLITFFIGFWYLQIIRGAYYEDLARENILKDYPLPAPRNFPDDSAVVNNTRYFYKVSPVYSDATPGINSPELGHTYSSTSANTDGPVTSYANVWFYYNLNDHLGSTRITTKRGAPNPTSVLPVNT